MHTRKVYCDPLRAFVTLPSPPQRIVCLASGLTEAIVHLGHGHRLVGISSWCPNFLPGYDLPIAGDYLRADEATLRALQPDLILLTSGVQRGLAYRLHQQGWPVYVLPLPNSLYGILENLLALGALLDDLPSARSLAETWANHFLDPGRAAPTPRPRLYVELWFGKHVRMAGGLTFVHDLIVAAGGENLFGDVPTGYLPLDLDEVERRNPEIFLCYSEPEYPLQGVDLARQRGWSIPVIQADVSPAHNLIHDGPSMMEVLRWLRDQIQRLRLEAQ